VSRCWSWRQTNVTTIILTIVAILVESFDEKVQEYSSTYYFSVKISVVFVTKALTK
jgi:hypothetical protein